MRQAALYIFLTIVCPLLVMASGTTEFRILQQDVGTYFLRIYDDPVKLDEIYFTNKSKPEQSDWLMLAERKIKEIHLPIVGTTITSAPPSHIKISHTSDSNLGVVLDNNYCVMVSRNDITPKRAYYQLPDRAVSEISQSAGVEFEKNFYRVISYKTKSGAKTILVRRLDGRFIVLAEKQIRLNSSNQELNVVGSTLQIPLLSKEVDLKKFEEISLTSLEEALAKPIVDDDNSEIQKLQKLFLEIEILKQKFKRKIFGQEVAVDGLINSYRELKTNHTNKPRVVLAMGPSGTGKSYTAEVLAELTSGGRTKTFRGTDYSSHKGSLDYMKLLGATKGTSASQEGELVTWVKTLHGQSGVLIIDEGDKMHRDVWLMLMEFLDKGVLNDNEGKEVRASNLIVMITTNRGVKRMFPSSSKNWSKDMILQRVKGFTQDWLKSLNMIKEGLDDTNILPQEVLNRIDEVLPYTPLTVDEAIEITKQKASEIKDYYRMQYNVQFDTEEEILKALALADFNGSVDGRALKARLSKIYSDALHLAVTQLNLKHDTPVNLQIGTNSDGHKIISVRVGDQSLVLQTLGQVKVNPMDEPVAAKRLLNIEEELNKIVLGQEESMKQIAQAAIAHRSSAENTRALVLFLGGISGNGKTETGRALARILYQSEDGPSIIPLSGVQNDGQFDAIFGISAQFQGGDTERLFEKALRENPDGGVIILDEISNMGGNNRAIKESLLMRFYELLEEGRYISPIDGREYDLGKYTILLTGNDGQEAFRGITADDLLVETWKEYSSPEKVRKTLLENGWPMALVNRIAVKLLLKPILSDMAKKIAQKLLNKEIEKFRNENPSVKIEVPENFADQLAASFFAPDQGARGIRDVLETKIRAALAIATLKTRALQTEKNDITLRLELSDSKGLKPYKINGAKEREILFKVSSSDGHLNETIEFIDLTKQGNFHILPSTSNAKRISFHEAGHAVVGEGTVYITIRGGNTGETEYYGYARHDHSKIEKINMDRERAIELISTYWAGRKAQEMAGFSADDGWSNDLKNIRRVMNSYFLKSGLDRDFAGILENDKGEPVLSAPLQRLLEIKMAKMEKEAEMRAEKILKENWTLVRAVVAELLRNGEIDGKRFAEIKMRNPSKAVQKPNFISNLVQVASSRLKAFSDFIMNRKNDTGGLMCQKLFE